MTEHRRSIIAGNWKMHKTVAEAKALAEAVRRGMEAIGGVDVVLCPPFTSLAAVSSAISGSKVALGAQDMYWEAEGAFTGEVSTGMLMDAGCKYVIVGHSERRSSFGETNEGVRRKSAAALSEKQKLRRFRLEAHRAAAYRLLCLIYHLTMTA